MRTQAKILIAFILNLIFSIFELIGGLFIGSVAILSDALHDLGDAVSIGLSYFLERKSLRPADQRYTYGYIRFSVLGSFITTTILATGSLIVIYNAVGRFLNPTPIHYDGMILFALVGVGVNFLAAWFTRSGDSLNQRAVNLHMLEDVLGWAVVLVGAIVMRFTNWAFLDPILSVAVALFILFHAAKNLKEIGELFLKKAPHGICPEALRNDLCQLPEILDVHHIHLWSLDGQTTCATMHIVASGDPHRAKLLAREHLHAHGISHVTLELEAEGEECTDNHCHPESHPEEGHHHHHHHHHH